MQLWGLSWDETIVVLIGRKLCERRGRQVACLLHFWKPFAFYNGA